MKLRLASIMMLLALLGSAALAEEETPKPEVEGAPPQEQAPAPIPEPAATSAPTPSTVAKSPETFVPSEEISEDLSVSFPVDI